MKKEMFPKILFIGTVTFQETTGSSLLFYRLFKNYPPEKLVVIGGEKHENPLFLKTRIPQVSYHIMGDDLQYEGILFYGRRFYAIKVLNNLVNKYFTKYLTQWKLFTYFWKAKKIAKNFEPDLILSLTMHFHWEIAHRIAKSLNIPLDLVLHDQIENHVDLRLFHNFPAKFEQVFKFARNRFCISPTMEKVYHQRFGVNSDVLFPIGKEVNLNPSENNPLTSNKTINMVFFGSIWTGTPTASSLIKIAHLLAKKGGTLTLFSNQNLDFFQERGLKTNNLLANPFFEKNEALLSWCKKNANVLCLPMSFGKEYLSIIQHSFPSKITDYTALGLPILVHAPATSSIAEFIKANPQNDFAALVTENSAIPLEKAIDALTDANYRQYLGKNSLKIWQRHFNPEVIRPIFYKKLLTPS